MLVDYHKVASDTDSNKLDFNISLATCTLHKCSIYLFITTLCAKIYKCVHVNRVPAGKNLIFIKYYKADPFDKNMQAT